MNSTRISKYNAAVTHNSGRVGNVRYVQKGGETYVRSASIDIINNPRTDAQMRQRMKFASLAAFYSLFGTTLHKAFANRKANQSDFNMFMRVNKGLGVYLSKDQLAEGQVVALPALIGCGKLAPVALTYSTNLCTANDIALPLKSLDDATVADFSKALIEANEGWSKGDVLTMFFVGQSQDNTCWLEKEQVTLDLTNTAKLSDVSLYITTDSNRLAFDTDEQGVFGVIHTNHKGGSSVCQMVCTGEQAEWISNFLSEDVFNEAKTSYGEVKDEAYLSGKSTTSEGGDKEYTLTVAVNDSDMGSVDPTTYTGKAGSVVKLTATPETGYHFYEWSDGSDVNPRSYTITKTETLTATFKLGEAPV